MSIGLAVKSALCFRLTVVSVRRIGVFLGLTSTFRFF